MTHQRWGRQYRQYLPNPVSLAAPQVKTEAILPLPGHVLDRLGQFLEIELVADLLEAEIDLLQIVL